MPLPPAPPPHRILFPLAALYGAIAIPVWLAWPMPLPAGWHAHEMLFGYAPAVLAGFLIARPGRRTWALAAAWLAGRVAPFLTVPALPPLLALAFPALLFWLAAPALWRGAKRAENYLLPAILLLILALDAAWWWVGDDGPWMRHLALATVDLYALLLTLVGGRALPAAVGGFLERQGVARRDHRRREWELPLAGVLGAMLLADLAGQQRAAGLLALLGAAALLLRMIPWQLPRTRTEPALWALALGYAWLPLGLAVKGAAQLHWLSLGTAAVHGVTVGALGTLTATMMARTAAARTRGTALPFGDMGLAALLLCAAAALRLTAAGEATVLWSAAAAWTLALLILLRRLWRGPEKTPGRGGTPGGAPGARCEGEGGAAERG